MRPFSPSSALLAALSLAPLSFAPLTAQELVPGKPAPALSIAKWVKGDAVAELKKDHVYVVEFWATWCGPCIAGMPHLSEVQKHHKGAVTVIGVTKEDESNKLADVEAMVKEKGDTMAYTVAWDDSGKTSKAWFEAAGQDGIPCCFVVDKTGTVAWIGHPMWLDVILPDVLAGKVDVKALAEKPAAVEKRLKRVFVAAQLKPSKAIEEAEALCKDYPFLTEQVDMGLFSFFVKAEDASIAWPIGERAFTRAVAAKDASTLNGIAWTIVDPEGECKKPNLELATKAAMKAVELTERKEPSILDTLARVHACKGEWDLAIAVQKEAVKLVPDEAADAKEQFEGTLKEYETKAKAAAEKPAEKAGGK